MQTALQAGLCQSLPHSLLARIFLGIEAYLCYNLLHTKDMLLSEFCR